MQWAGKIPDPDTKGRKWEVYAFFGDEPGTIDYVHMTPGQSQYARQFKWNEASDKLEKAAEELVLKQLDKVEYAKIHNGYKPKEFDLIEHDPVERRH